MTQNNSNLIPHTSALFQMITTSGGGALVTDNDTQWREIMMYATQYRESYPYYQHEHIGYNYRMSNICAGIGRGQERERMAA